MKTLSIAVLASTRATDLTGIMQAIKKKELNAQVKLLISDREDAGALEKAKAYGIPSLYLNPKDFPSKEAFDERIAEALEKEEIELVLLIGFMRFLSKEFVHKFENKIMNIHPSLLPAFAGGMDKNVHQAVLDSGVKVTGCTLHFATEDIDSGPIIMQKAVEISENESVDSLKEKVQEAEQRVLVKAIKLFSKGKIKVEGKKVKIMD
ncbi:MAG: phosphoribosylglycinamide formyltransferase [Candidatus Diapherotrites archaeon]